MRVIRKMFIVAALAFCMLCGLTVHAEGDAGVMETCTGEDRVTVYVKGASENLSDISVQIGTSTGEASSAGRLTEQDVSMRTIVMIDNSISITQENREKIADFLQNLIADRDAKEEMAITVFSEDVTWLTEYTSDYSTLKQAVDGIEYQDQETYLTDVLYDLISTTYLQDEEDVYRRIIVVSDGVDNKSLGYTKEELYSLLKENPYPIYSIGCVNGKNNEQLENMFALSRMTSAQSFLMDDVENTLDITDTLKADRDIVKLDIIPASEAMDGSRKTVRISYTDQGGAVTLSTEVTMPQQTQAAAEPEPEPEVEEEPPAEPQPPAPQEETNSDNSRKTAVLIAVFCFVVLAAVVIIIVLIVLKKKRKKAQFEPIDDNILQELERGFEPSDERTELVQTNVPNDDERTYMIWNNRNTYHVVLTDIHSMAKTFQVPLERSVTIGRRQGMCDIVLDYEKSVSGKHCEISVRDGKFYLKDLQSANGTYVNGSKVLSETEIFSGNVIKLGRLEMKFEVR